MRLRRAWIVKARPANMTKLFAIAAVCLPVIAFATPAIKKGVLELPEEDFQVGHRIELTGDWLFKPGYLVEKGDQPETDARGFGLVGVPQFLNRVHWWLDDSEDFKKHEEARLEKLGFDTEKAVDGWYQLQLDLPTSPKHRQVWLEFEGVAMICKVYCNGQYLGEHKGMFSRFSFELTPHLQGGENHIAVYVSMEKNIPTAQAMGEAVTVNLTASKVLTLSKGMFGPMSPGFDNHSYDLHGIWQPVKLVVRSSGKIEDAWFVPSLTGAEVRVQAVHSNPAMLHAKWTDTQTGDVLGEIGPVAITNSGNTVSKTLTLKNVKPFLWTPAHPNLYRMEVRLEGIRGEIYDEWTQNVGFRTFEVRGNKFFLNGHPYWLRGANQLPYGKNPWDPELAHTLIKLMHDGNIRVTRTHGTPWNEAWLNAADQIGLGVSLEGIRPWALAGRIGATPPNLFQHWLMENEDVIKRARNHPSVLLYTVGNEMMLRDGKNLDKWEQLSDVVKQTRRTDPTRPVIASSEYEREPNFYETVLKPNDIDDGDADDLHRYNNWYKESAFAADSYFGPEMKANGGRRPLLGQEMASGYSDLDTGLPVLRYTRDLLTPQSWIGSAAYPGSDPAIFLENNRAATKRWAEKLRFQRGDNTAGFMLFPAECWFSHSYDANKVSPYPVYGAVRDAFAPMGLAWALAKRRFYSGEELDTAVYLTNDDDQFRSFQDLDLQVIFMDAKGHKQTNGLPVCLPDSPYYKTISVPVHLTLPRTTQARQKMWVTFRLGDQGREISRTSDRIEIFSNPVPPHPLDLTVTALSLEPELNRLAKDIFATVQTRLPEKPEGALILAGPKMSLKDLAPDRPLFETISRGATAVLFIPSREIAPLFPDQIAATEKTLAEFGDISAILSTPIGQGLEPMDLKWWTRKNDNRAFIASNAHRLNPSGKARSLVGYIPPHGYTSDDKLTEHYWSVLSEIQIGYGRIWLCDLDLAKCMGADPMARIFAENLLRAAADPGSTRLLKPMPTHAELLKGKR